MSFPPNACSQYLVSGLHIELSTKRVDADEKLLDSRLLSSAYMRAYPSFSPSTLPTTEMGYTLGLT